MYFCAVGINSVVGVRPSSGAATRHCEGVGEAVSDCLLHIAVAEDGHTLGAGF